ncbi:hypothetical protein [Botrimarina mediterranea]|nr:hypothetical protein [Botrimarina mediterranea]
MSRARQEAESPSTRLRFLTGAAQVFSSVNTIDGASRVVPTRVLR